jgi:hypothetical protein
MKPPTSINPQITYVHLGADAAAAPLPGGAAFWSLPESEMNRYSGGWMISEFECSADWPSWEMHPSGDEMDFPLHHDGIEHQDWSGIRQSLTFGKRSSFVMRQHRYLATCFAAN